MRRSKNAAPGWRTPRAGARYGPRAISLVRLAAPLLRSFGSTSRTKDALTPGVNAGARRAIRSTPTRPFRLRQIHPASGDREPECNPCCALSGRPDFSGVGTRPIGRRALGPRAGLAIAALLGFGYKASTASADSGQAAAEVLYALPTAGGERPWGDKKATNDLTLPTAKHAAVGLRREIGYVDAEWFKRAGGRRRSEQRMAPSSAAGPTTTCRIGQNCSPPGVRTLTVEELSGRNRPAAVKMPESPPFLGTPILLEVGSFIGVRGPLAATIACC